MKNLNLRTPHLPLLLVGFLLPVSTQAFQAKDELPTIEITSSLFGISSGDTAFSKLQVPGVSPNQTYRLKLGIENGTARDIKFDEVRTSCGCAKFLPTKGTLLNEEIHGFDVIFRAPGSTASGEYMFTALLLEAGNPKVRLNFTCKLRGSLHVDKNWRFTIRNRERIALLPVNFTEPIAFSNLRLSSSDKLSKYVSSKLIEKDGNHYICVEVNPSGWHSNELVAGQLTVKDVETGAKATIELLGKKKGDLDASPSSLLFRPSGEDESDGIANIILEVDKAKVVDNATPSFSIARIPNQKELPDHQFTIVRTKKLSDSLYRIRLQHKREASNENPPGSIELRMQFPNHETMSIEMPCLYQY